MMSHWWSNTFPNASNCHHRIKVFKVIKAVKVGKDPLALFSARTISCLFRQGPAVMAALFVRSFAVSILRSRDSYSEMEGAEIRAWVSQWCRIRSINCGLPRRCPHSGPTIERSLFSFWRRLCVLVVSLFVHVVGGSLRNHLAGGGNARNVGVVLWQLCALCCVLMMSIQWSIQWK